ncbi:MAG: hypothetical protein AAF456_25755, partial [Planctomycetota bacterium]
SFMMIAMGVLFFKVPSGLCLYFITSSLWGIIERKMLPKPVLDTSKFDEGSELDGTVDFSDSNDNGQSYSNEANLAERKRRDKERKKKLRERGM